MPAAPEPPRERGEVAQRQRGTGQAELHGPLEPLAEVEVPVLDGARVDRPEPVAHPVRPPAEDGPRPRELGRVPPDGWPEAHSLPIPHEGEGEAARDRRARGRRPPAPARNDPARGDGEADDPGRGAKRPEGQRAWQEQPGRKRGGGGAAPAG